MTVFKYYLKIAKTFWLTILIHLVVFVTIMLMALSTVNTTTEFTLIKPKVAVFNHDNSALSEGLTDCFKESAELVEVADNDDARKEALYFSAVDAIVTIPADFGEKFMDNASPKLNIKEANGANAKQSTLLAENYLRLAEIRRMGGVNQQQIVEGVKQDIKQTATTEIHSQVNVGSSAKANYFFNFSAYIILSLNILIIGTIMLTFTSTNIKKRNLVSTFSSTKTMGQLLLGNAVFSLLIWLMMLVLAVISLPDIMVTMYGVLYSLNALVFSLVVLAIGLGLGLLIKNKNAIGGLNNLVSLSMSFLGGVFVPQALLSEEIVNVSKVLPSYWYVNSNELIYQLNEVNLTTLQPIMQNWLILLGFAVAIFVATIVLVRLRRVS